MGYAKTHPRLESRAIIYLSVLQHQTSEELDRVLLLKPPKSGIPDPDDQDERFVFWHEYQFMEHKMQDE
eukprot:2961837-Karenia_brevis.AAC.1